MEGTAWRRGKRQKEKREDKETREKRKERPQVGKTKEMNLVSNPKVELRGHVKAKILPAVNPEIAIYSDRCLTMKETEDGGMGWMERDGMGWMRWMEETG